ncbi:hypothetical protein WG66_014822, partial [Moniliophthora roreri]
SINPTQSRAQWLLLPDCDDSPRCSYQPTYQQGKESNRYASTFEPLSPVPILKSVEFLIPYSNLLYDTSHLMVTIYRLGNGSTCKFSNHDDCARGMDCPWLCYPQ